MNSLLRIAVLAVSILLMPLAGQADSASLLAQARAANPVRYQFAVDKKAEIRDTTDNRAFSIWWQPSATATPAATIVTLHGHASYATDDFYLWQPYAEAKGYALLALQWWFGGGEATSDYYQPQDMYPLIAALLNAKGIPPGTVLFTGFSRGSAVSYAMTVLDAVRGRRYFGMTLSNAGAAASDYPPNRDIDAGVYGNKPFSGVKWAMYCGEKDAGVCAAMNDTRTWVTGHGATVVLYIDDPNGDHGGFMLNSANVETALASFATVLTTAVPYCTLTASPASVSPGGSSTLTASCSPLATSYTWTGGSCAGVSGSICLVTPSVSSSYTVTGRNLAGAGTAASASVTVVAKSGRSALPAVVGVLLDD